MQSNTVIEKLPNGLVMLAEPMPWLQSAAFTLLVPCGLQRETEAKSGMAGITLEMVQRGAGERDSRGIVDALDFLGVDRSSSVSTFHSIFSAAMLSEALMPTLEIYADIVQRPHLPDEELEDAKQVALQELRSTEDDPAHKCLRELKRMRYSDPYGRSAYGSESGIDSVLLPDVQEMVSAHYRPKGAILAVAGKFEWATLRKKIEALFGGWNGGDALVLPEPEVRSGVRHIAHDSAQTHIALAYDCVPYSHPEYYHARGLVGVLSDGMSSRLFSEVREKRGLVYTVSASCQSTYTRGSVLCYAGTTSERAQETLEVTIQTIKDLAKGITDEELSRLKIRVKTALVMEQESSMSRSSQIAADWFHLGRIPARSEVAAKIEALTGPLLVEHFERHPAANWSLVTLGDQPLELPSGV